MALIFEFPLAIQSTYVAHYIRHISMSLELWFLQHDVWILYPEYCLKGHVALTLSTYIVFQFCVLSKHLVLCAY
jgi:hypothetical protein